MCKVNSMLKAFLIIMIVILLPQPTMAASCSDASTLIDKTESARSDLQEVSTKGDYDKALIEYQTATDASLLALRVLRECIGDGKSDSQLVIRYAFADGAIKTIGEEQGWETAADSATGIYADLLMLHL